MSFKNCSSSVQEFTMSQVNGCRYVAPKHGIDKNFVPPSGCEVYISKLPWDCYEKELLTFVSRVGPVFDLRLMVTMEGLNRGFAYVRYINPETAATAINELPKKPLRFLPNLHLNVQKSTDHRRLLVVRMIIRNAATEIKEVSSLLYNFIMNILGRLVVGLGVFMATGYTFYVNVVLSMRGL